MANLEDLSASQMAALGQLQGITNGADMDKELAILQSVGWDVQAAVQAIFDGQPVASSSSSPAAVPSSRRTSTKELEPMEIDDASQSVPNPQRRIYPSFQRPGLNLFSILTFPITFSFNIFASLLHFMFRILRIPIPRFFGYISLARQPRVGGPGGRPLLSGDPTDVAERFVRQLEEETGAMCISKAALVASEEGEAASAGASTSITPRQAGAGKLLPDFWLGSYESALRAAQREARIMCIVITSEEHDDTPEFRRTVLTDPELVRVLTDNQFIVWGGDIRDREGYQTALKLHATTYPFVAFISLHPARTNGSSTSQLSVLSRHEGPPSTLTSAAQLTQHITSSLLPRVTPHLSRIRAEHRARQQERELRSAQDRAFRDAERKDAERILKRREEERRKVEELERKRMEEEDRLNYERKKVMWRRFARRTMLLKEAPMSSATSVRIGIRLPSGERAIRRFNPQDSLTALYVFVDSQFLPADMTTDTDPDHAPEGFPSEPTESTWDFKLAVSFPRGQVDWAADKTIGDVPLLTGGANLVVELLRPVVDGSSSEEEDED